MSENGTNQERTEANTANIIAIDNKVNADSALITNHINSIKALAEGVDRIGTDKSRVGAALRTCRAPTPSTLNPTPYTLNPTHFILNPTPYTLNPTLFILNPTPYTLHPTP